MITTISVKESQLAHMLTVCSEALKSVTAERDAATNAALERASVVCEEMATTDDNDATIVRHECAAVIRALKVPA